MKLVVLLLAISMVSCANFERSSLSPGTPRKQVTEVDMVKKSDPGSPRKRMMVLPFLDSEPSRPQSLRDRARSAFIADLNRSGDLIALDSRDLKLDFEKFIKDGEYRLGDVAKEAKDLGVSVLMEGKIIDIRIKRKSDSVGIVRQMKTEFEVVVRARLITARSGKEIFNTVKTVTIEEANMRVGERVQADRFLQNNPELIEVMVKDAFLDFAPQLTDALNTISWEGRIAAISGDRIFLNVGRVSGIQVGDILKVTEEGEDVYDPESGSHIGKVPGRMKGTLEVISYFGTDGSISVIHSGAGFRENDRVELY